MTEKEILLEAIDIIGEFSEEVGDDNPKGYKIIRSYQSLIDDIKDFMKEVGYFDDEGAE